MSDLQSRNVGASQKYSAERARAWSVIARGIFRARLDIHVMKQAIRNLLEQGGTPMKWMWSTAFVVAVSAVASAESGEAMLGAKMNMTYTGCVEAVNHGGTYL